MTSSSVSRFVLAASRYPPPTPRAASTIPARPSSRNTARALSLSPYKRQADTPRQRHERPQRFLRVQVPATLSPDDEQKCRICPRFLFLKADWSGSQQARALRKVQMSWPFVTACDFASE